MRTAALVLLVALVAACDSAPAPFSTVDLDPQALPTPLVAGEPFRVVVSGESEPAPTAVRFYVYYVGAVGTTEQVSNRILSAFVPTTPGSRVEGETTVTIPASRIEREARVLLQVALFDADDTMLSSKSREVVVVPAP